MHSLCDDYRVVWCDCEEEGYTITVQPLCNDYKCVGWYVCVNVWAYPPPRVCVYVC